MEPTAHPDDGRQPGGPGRYRPPETGPVPAQRPAGPGEGPGGAGGDPAAPDDDRAGARPAPGATNDTQMVPLGSRRPADELLGQTTNGSRWTDHGGIPPVETNGHRNPDLGPRHGGPARINGENPVGGGTLPGSRSPFAPPPAPSPDTPPLYAPSPFAATGNQPVSDLPTDPLAPLDPPQDDRDGSARPAGGPPAATGSAQVPMPLGRPVSGQPSAGPPADAGTRAVPAEPAPDEHELWAPPAARGPAPASGSGTAGAETAFPGFGTVTPPSSEPGPGHTARWSGPEPAGERSGPERPGTWGRPEANAGSFRADPLPPNPLHPSPAQAPLPPNPLQPSPAQSSLPPNPLQPSPAQSSLPSDLLKPAPPQAAQTTPVPPVPASPLVPGPVPGGRRSRADEDQDTHPQGRRAAPSAEEERTRTEPRPGGRRAAADPDPREGRRTPADGEEGGRRAAAGPDPREGRRTPVDGEEGGRRARDEVPAGRRAAREAAGDGPLRPGDVDQTSIAFWDEAASDHFRGEWHEVKAQFVDDPVAALTRAHELLTEAVQELSEAMLAERDRLDPLRDKAVPDTESMRMAMRGYREFLDRILSL